MGEDIRTRMVELAKRLESMVDDPAWDRFYMAKNEAELCVAALRSQGIEGDA